MNYELAKKLEDAGFPHDWSEFEKHDQVLLIKDWKIYGKGYSPTLSELIEACGEGVFILMKNDNWADGWSAALNGMGAGGDTPEEAVANLWLKLQEV